MSESRQLICFLMLMVSILLNVWVLGDVAIKGREHRVTLDSVYQIASFVGRHCSEPGRK